MTRHLDKDDRHIYYFGEILQIIDLKSQTRILFLFFGNNESFPQGFLL
jgi:hypothetical protein